MHLDNINGDLISNLRFIWLVTIYAYKSNKFLRFCFVCKFIIRFNKSVWYMFSTMMQLVFIVSLEHVIFTKKSIITLHMSFLYISFPISYSFMSFSLEYIFCDKISARVAVHYLTSFFFLSGFSFTDTDDSPDSKGREMTMFYFSLPLPSAQEHSSI